MFDAKDGSIGKAFTSKHTPREDERRAILVGVDGMLIISQPREPLEARLRRSEAHWLLTELLERISRREELLVALLRRSWLIRSSQLY